jgi:hypothetical protein
MTTLPIEDRFSEHRTDNPYWNESVWFSISKPEEHLHGFVQYYFRPNMNMLNGGPVLWNPSGTFQWNCLYYNWSHLQAMPKNVTKFDMKARNSLTVKVLEPLKRYSIQYDKDDLKMDLLWEAIAPHHQLVTNDAGQTAAAKFHLEQAGKLKGTIVLGGKTIAIDCFSMRDTSAGPREYESLNSGGYFWGISQHSSFHAIAMGEGTSQKSIGGYIYKDGQMSSLVSGSRTVTEFGDYGPRRFEWEATDKLGRTMRATARVDDGLIFTGYTDHTVYWSLVEWDWDGVKHWGDNQEFSPLTRFRDIARKQLKLG